MQEQAETAPRTKRQIVLDDEIYSAMQRHAKRDRRLIGAQIEMVLKEWLDSFADPGRQP